MTFDPAAFAKARTRSNGGRACRICAREDIREAVSTILATTLEQGHCGFSQRSLAAALSDGFDTEISDAIVQRHLSVCESDRWAEVKRLG